MQAEGNFCVYKGADPKYNFDRIWESGSEMKRLLLDQKQSQHFAETSNHDLWQSFTVGQSGLLKQLELSADSPLWQQPQFGAITFYEGEGIDGKLIAQATVVFQYHNNYPDVFQSFQLTIPFPVLSDRKYTFRVQVPATPGMKPWVALGLASRYTRGRAWGRAISYDSVQYALRFRTYVLVV